MARRPVRALGIALTLLAACGGDDEAVDTTGAPTITPSANDDDTDPSDEDGFLPYISPESEYVTALCSIDIGTVLSDADPASALIDAFRSVPTADAFQSAEIDAVVSALQSTGDTLADHAQLTAIGAIIATRCSS